MGKPASRQTDRSYCPADSHGNICCAHAVIGPAVEGSPNVSINALPALRQGDAGEHAMCCGPNMWKTSECSSTVFVNGRGAVRLGDQTVHCGGEGSMVDGSGNVFIGG